MRLAPLGPLLIVAVFGGCDGFAAGALKAPRALRAPSPEGSSSLVVRARKDRIDTVEKPLVSQSEAEIGFEQETFLVKDLPEPLQAAVVAAISLGMVVGTSALLKVFQALESASPALFNAWKTYTWPVPLGLAFLLAGIAHFTNKEDFEEMVPPMGTWGIWKVPALDIGLRYTEFHVLWTGVAEIVGGVLLITAGLGKGIVSVQVAALLLLLLTAAVTPANIYHFTHDKTVPFLPPTTQPVLAFRLALQCTLFAFFYSLAFM